MSQQNPPITLQEGRFSPSYYVYENSLSINQFQSCWICKGWACFTLSINRFKNDQNPHEYCWSCYNFVLRRAESKCDLWKHIMEESLNTSLRKITGDVIRADIQSKNLRKLQRNWMHRTTIINVPQNRRYNAECDSPFDPMCAGANRLHLNK